MADLRLHGFASSGRAFRRTWEQALIKLPSTVHFPDAPLRDPITGQRCWFAVSNSEERLAERLVSAATAVETEIAETVGQHIPIDLAGHSQGGMLALEIACRGRLNIRSVTCYAAYLPLAQRHSEAAGINFTFYSSLADRFVPRKQVLNTVIALRSAGAESVLDLVSKSNAHAFGVWWLDTSLFERQDCVAA
jgi:predicted esterase